MGSGRRLSTGEWSVLGLLNEAPAHGWSLAAALAPTGEIGAVWSLSRALVYRALDTLHRNGLVEVAGAASSTRGPSRTVFRPTRSGRSALSGWLAQPVEHIRNLRPDLLLKLVFLARAGKDPGPLLERQQTLVEGLLAEIETASDGSVEQAILVRYRLEVARAALRFVEAERDAAVGAAS
jgi:DNA-binding PadR family transcriptional regulator